MNINDLKLGAINLSPAILGKANIGLWAFELDEGGEPRMYVDDTMLGLVGLEHQVSPEETYHAWYDHIDEGSYDLVNSAVQKMSNGEHAEIQYPWHHPDGHTLIVRCGGIRNYEYKKGIRIEGTHQDVSEIIHFQKKENDAQDRLQGEIFSEMLGDEGLFIIDCEKDTRRTIHNLSHKIEEFPDSEQYSELFTKYVNTYVSTIDREEMLKYASPAYLLDCLKKRKELKIPYRDLTSGTQRFYEMKIAKFSDHEIIQSFVERDREFINNLILSKLEEDYFALYGVDLDTGLIQVIKDSPFYPQGDVGTVKEYTPTIRKFANAFEGETKEFFERISDINYLKRRFATENKSTFVYKSHFAGGTKWVNVTKLVLTRHADGTPSLFALGFNLLDYDSSAKEEFQKLQRESFETRKFIDNIISTYNIVYRVNMVDNTFKILRMDKNMLEKNTNPKNFSEVQSFFLEHVVHMRDKEKMRRELDFATIRTKLADKSSYEIEYSAFKGGVSVGSKMKVTAINKDEIIIGMSENDKELLLQHIQQKRYDDYFALYVVDIDTEIIKVFKALPWYKNGMKQNGAPYSKTILSFAESLDEEPKAVFQQLADIEFIKQMFAKEEKHTYSYKSNNKEGKWVVATSFVTIRHEDGTPAEFTLGFSYADSLDSSIREAQSRIQEDMHMIGGLADEYDTLYYVNIKESVFRVFACDRERFPEEAKIVGASGNPFTALQAFGSSDAIHPEDKKLFAACTVESALERLAHSKKFSFRYRINKNGYYEWWEMTVIKYEDIDQPANAIAIGFANRDSEIRSEQVLNGCYEVLGKEMPPKEAIDTVLTLTGEYYGADRAYIFEYSDDKETIINTFEWCKNGIEPMISQLQSVPAEQVSNWVKEFERQGAFYMDVANSELNTPDTVATLEMQGIKSLIAAPIMNGDEVVGLIGIDNPTRSKQDTKILKRIGVVTYSEILRRNQTQMAMYQSAKTFSDAFLSSYVSSYYINLTDCSQVIFNRSEFIEKQYGAIDNYLESITKYINECVHPEDRAKMLEAVQPDYIKKKLENESSFSLYMRDLSGTTQRWYRFDVTKGSDDDHAGLAFTDVTEKLEEENRKQEKMREDMEMIGGLASEYHALYYFNIKEKFFKVYSIDEKRFPEAKMMVSNGNDPMGTFIRFGMSDFVHPDDRWKFKDLTLENLKAKLAHTKKFVTRFRRKFSGKYLWTEMEIVKYEPVDEPANAVGIGFAERDAIIRKEQEQKQKLEEALSLAKAASNAKSRFLFNMSHDIRTPMNAITGFTAMAKKYAEGNEAVLRYIDKIDVSGQQLLMLINQVLEMARIESGKVELNERPINIKDRFDTMVTLLEEQAATHGLNFTHSLKDIKHFNVFADDARMSQITLNIVGNAFKYTPEGGNVEYSLREIPARKEGRASFVFTVADTGIGMSEEYLKSLYEPFTRENSSTVSKIQGTGLGMSIVKSLIDLAGGTIDVKSELGKGTRFNITLDFLIDNANEESKEAAAAEKNLSFSFKGKRVLLVEDNEMNREIARYILEEKGAVVVEAEDGDIAVKNIEDIVEEDSLNYYDFILMDVQMPIMDGYKATKKIRSILEPLGVHIPIIALSANAFEEDRQKSIKAGMDEHVAKPINIDQLWETLAKFL